ncbi:hypothetical protein QMK17_20710 [Rhodococcus sp. G-MC3]|uniref:hypothetical protein n=1 Tax=Rhodococcus sp. G-MC3 TaxID=3046209 RepID=UPI0024BA5F25|nr:hypothetical protein [Rhodococcus sp. G-MC3]MDJ0395747.1 hypothetical protein [Rhodococcus sp. G-MC3]
MSSDTDSMELIELEEFDDQTDAVLRRRATAVRLAAAAGAIVALIVVLAVLPILGITYPYSRGIVPSLTDPSKTALKAFGITPVPLAVAGLTVVALVRKLPYGIGAVITLVVGASLTTAAVRTWANGLVPESALPNGNVAACVALICAATLVASRAFLPMVWGLGAVAAMTISAGAVLGGAATIVGILTTALIVAAWWAASSAVMLYSPVAAEREAMNPLDTAAMALRNRLG